jgi:hypothetical protein
VKSPRNWHWLNCNLRERERKNHTGNVEGMRVGGDLQGRLRSEADFELLKPFIQKAYEQVGA